MGVSPANKDYLLTYLELHIKVNQYRQINAVSLTYWKKTETRTAYVYSYIQIHKFSELLFKRSSINFYKLNSITDKSQAKPSP